MKDFATLGRNACLQVVTLLSILAGATELLAAGEAIRAIPLPRRQADRSIAATGMARPDLAVIASQLATILPQYANPLTPDPSPRRGEGIEESPLQQRLGRDVHLAIRPRTGTPMEIRGAALQPALRQASSSGSSSGEETARQFLRSNGRLLRLDDPDRELQLVRDEIDPLHRRHMRYEQRFRGIPVWPAELTVHLDSAGNVDLLNGAHVPTPRKVFTKPIVDSAAATRRARAALGMSDRARVSAPELIIYSPLDRAPRLGWKLDLSSSLVDSWTVVVDAINGTILLKLTRVIEANVRGSGIDLSGTRRPLNVWQQGSTYYMVDTTKPMFDPSSAPPDPTKTRGAIIVYDAANQPPTDNPQSLPATLLIRSSDPNFWSIPDSVGAAFWLSETYEYFRERHGRNSLDGRGGTMQAVVRLGAGMQNAFWLDEHQLMVFGDGDRYAGSLDAIAHEMSHGVTSKTAQLIYKDQSGAMNEAFSDIFGEMSESRHYGTNDWIIGSQLNRPLRNMANPSQFQDPAKFSQYVQTEQDNGGVHTNSGIINQAFYQLAQGLAGALGRTDAERIFYRALTVHLVKQSQFIDARLAAIRSAEELFGAGSTQARRTAEAFDAVEIFDAAATEPPPTYPQINSADSTLFISINPQVQTLFLGRREEARGDPPQGVFLSRFDVAQARPSVSGDGSLAAFVDSVHDVCLIDTDSSSPEECVGLPNRGIRVNSVGMSPGGERFAFVLLNEQGEPEDRIIVIELPGGASRSFDLEGPTFDGQALSVIAFADVLDFTADARFIVYDALNVVPLEDGSLLGIWSIYALDIDEPDPEEDTFVVIPIVLGLDIGNPSLSQTSDNFLTFEVVNAATEQSTVFATNLNTGDIASVATLSATVPVVPGYSGDDRAIVYAVPSATTTGASLVRQPLAEDRISPVGAPALWLNDAAYGVIYRRGSYGGPTTNPGAIEFSSASYSGNEGTTVTVTVNRRAGVKGSVSVGYSASGGTATPGVDYASVSGTLSWADGESESKSFKVTVHSDSATESNETVVLRLASPAGGASLGDPSTATLTIADRPAKPRRRRLVRTD